MQAIDDIVPMKSEMSSLEMASRYKAGETIRELIQSTGYSQRRVRTAIASFGVPFRRKGRRLHKNLANRPPLPTPHSNSDNHASIND